MKMQAKEYRQAAVVAEDGKRLITFYYTLPEGLFAAFEDKCQKILSLAAEYISGRMGKRAQEEYAANPDPRKKLHVLPLSVRMEADFTPLDGGKCLCFSFFFHRGSRQVFSFPYCLALDEETGLFFSSASLGGKGLYTVREKEVLFFTPEDTDDQNGMMAFLTETAEKAGK